MNLIVAVAIVLLYLLLYRFSQFCAIKFIIPQQENNLINIDESMDVQFSKPGTPERERFREEARTYVNGHAKTAECRNSQKKRK